MTSFGEKVARDLQFDLDFFSENFCQELEKNCESPIEAQLGAALIVKFSMLNMGTVEEPQAFEFCLEKKRFGESAAWFVLTPQFAWERVQE